MLCLCILLKNLYLVSSHPWPSSQLRGHNQGKNIWVRGILHLFYFYLFYFYFFRHGSPVSREELLFRGPWQTVKKKCRQETRFRLCFDGLDPFCIVGLNWADAVTMLLNRMVENCHKFQNCLVFVMLITVFILFQFKIIPEDKLAQPFVFYSDCANTNRQVRILFILHICPRFHCISTVINWCLYTVTGNCDRCESLFSQT